MKQWLFDPVWDNLGMQLFKKIYYVVEYNYKMSVLIEPKDTGP